MVSGLVGVDVTVFVLVSVPVVLVVILLIAVMGLMVVVVAVVVGICSGGCGVRRVDGIEHDFMSNCNGILLVNISGSGTAFEYNTRSKRKCKFKCKFYTE